MTKFLSKDSKRIVDANELAESRLRWAHNLEAELKLLRKRNVWLEEIVALAQEHELLDLSNSNEWPQWESK